MNDVIADPELTASVRRVPDSVRYLVLGTVDDDGRPRTSPVYFVPRRYEDLYCVSAPGGHHTRNLHRDHRLSAVVFDSTQPPSPDVRAGYLTGTAEEVIPTALDDHIPMAFDPQRGGRAFTAAELTGDADLRLWVMHVTAWEDHVPGGHPRLGAGTDRRVRVDPRPTQEA